jgi:hypothetical protein
MEQIFEMLKEMKAEAKLDANQAKAEAKADVMLAKLDAYQEKAVADRKADKEEIKAEMRSKRSELDEAIQHRIEGIKARTEAMRRKIGSSHMEMVSAFKPEIEEEMMACRESMEACPEKQELTSVDTKPEVAQQEEVPVEDAEVMPVGEPKKKRRRDRKLATERCHQEPNCAPQKKLDVTRRGTSHCATAVRQKDKRSDKRMSRRATVARCMRDIFKPNTTRKGITVRKDRTRDNMV